MTEVSTPACSSAIAAVICIFSEKCRSEEFSSVGHVRHVAVCGAAGALQRCASWCAVLGFDDPAQAFACGG